MVTLMVSQIGADGPNSPVRSFAKIPSYGWSYDTQAIVCTMEHPPKGPFLGPNTTAYQRFLPTGPIAFLPISATVSSLVWSTQPALSTALKACDPSVLARMINAAFRLPDVSIRYLHGRILEAHEAGKPMTDEEINAEIIWREKSHSIDATSAYSSIALDVSSKARVPPSDAEMVPPIVTSIQAGTIASFPLRYNHTETYIGEGSGSRTVLVGDAAHTIHPLAGQGLNLGLGDVECLARCITEAILRGGDIGSYLFDISIMFYVSSVLFQKVPTLLFSHTLKNATLKTTKSCLLVTSCTKSTVPLLVHSSNCVLLD